MPLRDRLFYFAGLGFLTLAKCKSVIKGYSTPKPFSMSEAERCVAYDIQVVDHWLAHLQKYMNGEASLTGKNILELGPGSDLGVGLYLLSRGAARYNACDVNDLTRNTPYSFYEAFLEKLAEMNCEVSMAFLKDQLHGALHGEATQLKYIVRKDFNLVSAFGADTIDIVFSQAAFEHFDDVERTIAQLSIVCRPGALIVAEIDLKTHSRWIRDKDPNNIYRYPEAIYRAFWYRGIPNRVRPHQYKEIFERYGWRDISILPLATLVQNSIDNKMFAKPFRAAENQMDFLSIMLFARKR